MLRVTRAWWTTIDSGQNRTESLTHAFFKFEKWQWSENTIATNDIGFTNRIVITLTMKTPRKAAKFSCVCNGELRHVLKIYSIILSEY